MVHKKGRKISCLFSFFSAKNIVIEKLLAVTHNGYIYLKNYWWCSTDKLIRFIKSLLKGPPSEEVQLKISF